MQPTPAEAATIELAPALLDAIILGAFSRLVTQDDHVEVLARHLTDIDPAHRMSRNEVNDFIEAWSPPSTDEEEAAMEAEMEHEIEVDCWLAESLYVIEEMGPRAVTRAVVRSANWALVATDCVRSAVTPWHKDQYDTDVIFPEIAALYEWMEFYLPLDDDMDEPPWGFADKHNGMGALGAAVVVAIRNMIAGWPSAGPTPILAAYNMSPPSWWEEW